MHDLLATKVPDIDPNRIRPVLAVDLPPDDVDPFGLGPIRVEGIDIEGVVYQACDQGRLADGSLADYQHLGLEQRLGRLGTAPKVELENLGRGRRTAFVRSGTENLRWQAQGIATVQIERPEPTEPTDLRRQSLQLVVPELQAQQLLQLPDLGWQEGELVVA